MMDHTDITSFHEKLRGLAPWNHEAAMSATEWHQYIATARLARCMRPADVEQGLLGFLDDARGSLGIENETRLFLLMRVMFDLPRHAPVDQRRIFKGWTNWPEPDADGYVDLSWPVDWGRGAPALLAGFEGADGPRYAAVEEFGFLRERFPFREFGSVDEEL